MQEAILVTGLLLQKFDFRLSDPHYEIAIQEAMTLKPKNLFMHAKIRSHIDDLGLQRSLFNSPVVIGHDKKAESMNNLSTDKASPIITYYRSSTSTCIDLAHRLAKFALQRGFNDSVKTLNEAEAGVPTDRLVVIITSTQYEGQPPGELGSPPLCSPWSMGCVIKTNPVKDKCGKVHRMAGSRRG
jgi:cytochrome P450 / NADPH-cytochrome P450 reductase